MCVACIDIALDNNGRVNDISTSVIHHGSRLGLRLHKLSVMELMPAPFLTVHYDTTITQQEFAVCLSRRNAIGQHSAHFCLTIHEKVEVYRWSATHRPMEHGVDIIRTALERLHLDTLFHRIHKTFMAKVMNISLKHLAEWEKTPTFAAKLCWI